MAAATVHHGRSLTSDASPLPVGAVAAWMLPTAPTGWLLCHGGEVPIADYPRLYNLLTAGGTVFPFGANTDGLGASGSTHFRLPDLRGRFLSCAGATAPPGTVGNAATSHTHTFILPYDAAASATGGSHKHNYSGPNLNEGFSHGHTVTISSGADSNTTVSTALMGVSNTAPVSAAFDNSHSHSANVGVNLGGGHGHNIYATPGNPSETSSNDHSHSITFARGSGDNPVAVSHLPLYMDCHYVVYAGGTT